MGRESRTPKGIVAEYVEALTDHRERERSGRQWKAKELAAALSASKLLPKTYTGGTVSKWAKGTNTPGADVLIALALLTDRPLDDHVWPGRTRVGAVDQVVEIVMERLAERRAEPDN